MSPWQNASAYGYWTYSSGIATINTWFACQYASAYNLLLQAIYSTFNLTFAPLRLIASAELLYGLDSYSINGAVTLHFVSDRVCAGQTVGSRSSNGINQLSINCWWNKLGNLFTNFGCQLFNSLDNNLHLLMTEHYRAEHYLFRQLVGLRLNHQYRFFGTSNNQIKIAIFVQTGLILVQQILTIFIANTGCTNRTLERETRDSQSGRGADQGWNLRINSRV